MWVSLVRASIGNLMTAVYPTPLSVNISVRDIIPSTLVHDNCCKIRRNMYMLDTSYVLRVHILDTVLYAVTGTYCCVRVIYIIYIYTIRYNRYSLYFV